MTEKQRPCVIIAIDGPSGVGKSTAAQRLAHRLGYRYIDSGALYRAVGWLACAQALALEDPAAIVACLQRTPIELTFPDGTLQVWVAGRWAGFLFSLRFHLHENPRRCISFAAVFWLIVTSFDYLDLISL